MGLTLNPSLLLTGSASGALTYPAEGDGEAYAGRWVAGRRRAPSSTPGRRAIALISGRSFSPSSSLFSLIGRGSAHVSRGARCCSWGEAGRHAASAAHTRRFVFVPGWLYAFNLPAGADLAAQREILRRHGARVRFAELDENGFMERNAGERQQGRLRGRAEPERHDRERPLPIDKHRDPAVREHLLGLRAH